MKKKSGAQVALSDARGPLNDLLAKLAGEDGELWLKALCKFLRKENPWEKQKPESFKVIEIGTYKDVNSLYKSLEESGTLIGDQARNILNKTRLGFKQSLDLVVLSAEELGFPRGAILRDIYEVAKSQGLDICPAEVGPQLRLQYPDQPKGEWLTITMKPIKDVNGDPLLFLVGHDGANRRLHACRSLPNDPWCGHRHFVFCRK